MGSCNVESIMPLFADIRSMVRAIPRDVQVGSLVVCAALALGPVARADGLTPSGATAAPNRSTLALDPTTPQVPSLPGGVTPGFGSPSASSQDWRFDFHGFITAPLNVGFNSRPNAQPGQSTTVLHAPPEVPDDFETFSHTSVVPMTYAQLTFSESNDVVSANVSILARQATVSESFLEPASQEGITDAFLSYLPKLGPNVRMRAIVGAFTSRYGSPGEYDEGRYGTPLIARIGGAGELIGVALPIGPNTLMFEQGLQGQTNTASASITPDVWNDFADPEEGTTFVDHFHAGFNYRSWVTVGAHFINAQSHDDRATGPLAPDGSISVLAADIRLSMHRFGNFYFAFASTKASHARVVSRILSILNTPGGPGLANDYLGPVANGGDATGTLTTGGAQYDLSLARLVNFPAPFAGDGPDVFVSVFGLGTSVSSAFPRQPGVLDGVAVTKGVYGDGVTKIKVGAEGTYSVLPWLAFSARFDRVMPAIDDSSTAFSVLSPRVIFRTGWTATDALVLQYSHWFDGRYTTVRTGEPAVDNLDVIPDSDVLSLSANIWW
jgi:hypothetical protein